MKSIYLAGPLGFSEIGKICLYERIVPLIENAGFAVIDPWTMTPESEFASILALPHGAERHNKLRALNMRTGERNIAGVKSADGLLAVLDGSDVDSGTAAEIGYAAALGKPVIGYRGDFRTTGENESVTVNLLVEYLITLHGGKIVHTLDDLPDSLTHLMKH